MSSTLRTHAARVAVGVAALAAASAVSMGPAAAADSPSGLHADGLSESVQVVHPDGLPENCVSNADGGNTAFGAGYTMYRGAGAVCSGNLQYELVEQTDGNLVIYRASDGHSTWASGTVGDYNAWAVMQSDGNFVIYRPDGSSPWSTRSPGHPGAYACMQNDGVFVIYAPGGGFCSGEVLAASNRGM